MPSTCPTTSPAMYFCNIILRYLSMFSILDEQSSLPKCTDITLVDAFHKQFASHPNYDKPRFGKESFVIKHFAGSVT
jgi:myosin heavy subunit